MNTPQHRRLFQGKLDYWSYIRSLTSALWYRLDERGAPYDPGNIAYNYGLLGSVFDGAYIACNLAQQGKLSVIDAVLFDGVNSKLTIPAGAYGAFPSVTIAALVKYTSSGEAAAGRTYDQGGTTLLRFGSGPKLRAQRAATGGSVSITIADALLATWVWKFITYQDSGDRKSHIWKGQAGAVSEEGYSTNAAATGTLTDQSAVALVVGNNAGQANTMDGLMDEFLLFPYVLSLTQMLQIVRLTGV